jgi:hypothetical protein
VDYPLNSWKILCTGRGQVSGMKRGQVPRDCPQKSCTQGGKPRASRAHRGCSLPWLASRMRFGYAGIRFLCRGGCRILAAFRFQIINEILEPQKMVQIFFLGR